MCVLSRRADVSPVSLCSHHWLSKVGPPKGKIDKCVITKDEAVDQHKFKDFSVDRSYADTVDKVESLEAMNNNSRTMLQGRFDRLEELKRKWQEHQKMNELELKLQKLNTEYGWANFNDCDERHNEAVAVS